MRATLQITAGLYAGRKIVIREGEIAQFGRTEWADYSFPADKAMADRHFLVQCSPRKCSLQDLQSAGGTLVDGREAANVELRTGNVITAGQTSFLVLLGDDALPTASAPDSAAPPRANLLPLAKTARVSKPASAVAQAATSLETCVATLLEQQLVDDALGIVGVALPPLVAFDWALANFQATFTKAKLPLDPANQAAVEIARQWRAEPSDDLARQCEAAASALELETPAAWLAFCAFFAQNNLAPPDSDPIPAAPGVCGNTARTCLLLTSALLPVPEIAAARRLYVDDALSRSSAVSK